MSLNREQKLFKLTQIYARDGRRCWWCGKLLIPINEIPKIVNQTLPADYPTIDHLVPRSHSGSNRIENLVASCNECNGRRGNSIATYQPQPTYTVGVTADCPDCENGVWLESDGRVCPSCNGAAVLSAERAVELWITARQARRNKLKDLSDMRRERDALKEIIENEIGPGAARRNLATSVAAQGETIRHMSDAILRMKVEIAELRGSDLSVLIPNNQQRERALRLVENG